MRTSPSWFPFLQSLPLRFLMATAVLAALAAVPRIALGLEQLCRAIGIGHGPGYHANGCPWCPSKGKCAPGVMCQPQGSWSGYPGAAPGGYGYGAAGYAAGPMGAGYGAAPYKARIAEPVPTPAASDDHAPSEPHPADIELAPGEVLLEPPRNIEDGHAQFMPKLRASLSAVQRELPAGRSPTVDSPAVGYGVPATNRGATGSTPVRTFGGYAIGYSQAPTTIAQQPPRLSAPMPPDEEIEDDETIVASKPLPQREWGKIRSTGPVITAPVVVDRSSDDE